ncbi:MAG: hypothetical protein U0790_21965 [Isosphaeraceae bacterium]
MTPSVALVVCMFVALAPGAPAFGRQAEAEDAPVVITLDGADRGRTFEGIGALSAGASSRMLIEYPEPQRSQVLDLLFRPHYGAAFQHLKVEVGGDVNSTDGTEPSHARTREEFLAPRPEFFRRGYEWWLLREAKRRNPAIKLDILQWGAPGWIGGAGSDRAKFFSQDNAEFLVSFIRGAKREHGLDLDYCGIWNETPHDVAWIKRLRATLDRNGLSRVGIVAADQTGNRPWEIAREIASDRALSDAVRVVGAHYPKAQSTPEAIRSGKPLWSSEDGPWRGDWEGARALAKAFNRNYIQGKMTKTIIWSLVSSYYPQLPLPDSGPMRAREPWSGHFEIQPALWAVAHTTQFANPGWTYLDRACGMLGSDGSHVALRSPDPGGMFSVILEAVDARRPRRVSLRLAGGLTADRLHVWRSNAACQFEQQPDLLPHDEGFALTVEPGSIYSVTNTTGQVRGSPVPPPSREFPLPYSDGFEETPVGTLGRHLADQGGVFEVVSRDGGMGRCLRQVIPGKGIDWPFHPTPEPYSLLGSASWTDYEVRVDAQVEGPGKVSIWGRVVASLQSAQPAKGYWLEVSAEGTWGLHAFDRLLASGKCGFAPGRWHRLGLSFAGSTIRACLDGTPVATLGDTTFARGMAGLGTGWNHADFDDLVIRPNGSGPAPR